MRAIPAIDLLDGNVVRLKKGDFAQVTVYDRDPLHLAHLFAESGLTHLHVVDLNGAKDGHFTHLRLIETIVRETGLIVQTGGGIQRFEDLATLFDAGVRYAVSSSMAMNSTDVWARALTTYGDRCVFGMDLKDGRVAVSGWLETRDAPLADVLTPMIGNGLRHVLCTDIARDGMLSGANDGLYSQLMADWPELLFTASGGVADADDLERLSGIGVHAVVVGRAYFENRIGLETLLRYTLRKQPSTMKQSFALVLLVTVIVGVATVIAIQSFTNATSDDVNLDAVRQDMASLAAAARGYHMRPVALDGGGGVFTGITFRKIVFATDFIHPGDLISHNANGTYVLLATDSSVSITAFPADRPGYVTGDTTGVSLNAVATTGTITWIRMEPDSADAPAL